ncbi:restriction endonuclease subunit S [Bifidobacterium sp.]|uniref:restriction endonuclease subunit S n=1 Tax=Bifidobacterium sp. TaxID=41200 RepID=UPI00257D7301|nr:restriction endonuclease subunit S [Bifidobacterium sp.]
MAEQHGKTLVPQIRFAGFTDPWEQRKLGDVAAVYDGVHQTPDYQDEGVMFLSVENIATLTSQKFISREAFAKDYPVYPKHGDVLMTRIGDIGTSNVVETDDKLAFYVSLALLKPFDVDSYYLDKSLQSPSAKEELYRRTLHIAFPKKINKNQIAEVMLPIPRSRQEQEQIGALFRDLDSLITLHQRKYDKLCVLKKSMLDKMFPKGGSLYPEIRFAGFTDPWEQRKLGDILQERNVRTSDFESNPIFSLTIEDGITPKTDRYERTSLITKTEDLFKIVSPNEFVTNPMNLRFGAFGYNKNSLSVCVSGYYDVFSIDNDKCSGFWNSYFKTPVALKRFDDAATGSLIEKRRVKYSTLCQLIFLMPKGMGEKKQIGAFFDRLDSLITLHQRKLELLRNIKKSMLDKMFV